MTDASVIIAGAALVVSAIGFFYRIGRDSKNEPPNHEEKLDQIVKSTDSINRKLDEIAEWQREATAIHSTHGEQLRTLFRRLENVETRINDRGIIIESLQKILERLS